MKKNLILSSVAMAVLLFSGCSTNKPTVDETTQTTAQTTATPALESSSINSNSNSGATVPSAAPVTVTSEAPVTVASDTASAAVEEPQANVTSNTVSEASMNEIAKNMSSVYFDFDKFNIREDMKENVANDVKAAKALVAKHAVKLEGNCDEWGSDEYNMALGLKRAQALKTELVNAGVEAANISMVSLGKTAPVCADKTQECWSKNRRVDFKLLP